MPTVAELLDTLATRAPSDKAAGWDRHGLQLGDHTAPVSRVGVCHEVTEEVVGSVEESGIDLLITYHPLLFRPLTTVVAGRGPGGRAYRLLRAGVAVATIHTAWDAAPGGTADALAEALGLGEVRGFASLGSRKQIKLVTFVPAEQVEVVASALAEAGAGEIGNYRACSFRSEGVGTFVPAPAATPYLGEGGTFNTEKEVRLEMVAPADAEEELISALVASHPYEEPAFDVYEVRSNQGLGGRMGTLPEPVSTPELATRVERALGARTRVTPAGREKAQSVAVMPGAGGAMVRLAAATGAEAFVTGDVSHHQAVEARDLGLMVIDAGHAATERPGIRRLTDVVAASGVDTAALDFDPTPWLTV